MQSDDRFTHAEMAEELEKLLWSKATWLADFEGGKSKRPDWEIEIRRREHAVLKQAAADYRRAAGRSPEHARPGKNTNDNMRVSAR